MSNFNQRIARNRKKYKAGLGWAWIAMLVVVALLLLYAQLFGVFF